MQLLVYRQSGVKRVFCYILCLMVMVLTIYAQYQDVHAVIPLVLGGVALAGAATLLVAAGLTFSSSESATYSANSWFNDVKGDTTVLMKFTEFYEQTSQIKIIDDLLWSKVRDWVNSKYDVGTNTLMDDDTSVKLNEFVVGDYIYRFSTGLLYTEAYAPYFNQGTLSLDKYTLLLEHSDDWPYEKVTFYRNGLLYSVGVAYIKIGSFISTGFHYVDDSVNWVNIYYRYIPYNSSIVSNLIINQIPYSLLNVQDMVVSGQAVVGNPAWDLPRTVEGDRAVSVPADISGVVGKTYDDVLPDTANPPVDPPTEPGEWDKTKWVVPADVIKNKFPFSIPWDLKNAVTSLTATPQAPRWIIDFPSNVFVGGGQIDIDFRQFESWAKIIRWGVLIFFNVFLILSTRKIIGAGG